MIRIGPARANRAVRAVLFDLDNTLYDHTSASRQALLAMTRELEGLAGVHDELLCREFDRHNDACWALAVQGDMTREELRVARFRRTLQALGLELEAEMLSREYLRRYAAGGREVAGARATVLRLLERLPVGIVTNGYLDLVHVKLETIGLAGAVSPVVVAEHLEEMKPRPPAFRRALAALGLEPAEVLFVGDSLEVDVAGAHAAGLLACWFNREGLEVVAAAVRPDLIIRELAELTELGELASGPSGAGAPDAGADAEG